MDFMNDWYVFLIVSVLASCIPVGLYFWGRSHVSKTQIAMFCRQMSIMLDAGIPLLRVFEILSQRISHPKFRKIIAEILESVEN